MPLQLPNTPNFNVNPPQIPPPLETYGKMLQLKALSGQQALLPLEIQSEQEKVKAQQTANQQSQLELQSQQSMMKAWSDPDFLKNFTGTDKAQSSGLGFDPDGMSSALISKGVLPKDAMAMTQMFVDRSAKIADTLKAQAQTGEAQAGIREKTLKQVADALGAIQSKPVSDAQDALDAFKQKLVRDPKAFPGLTQDELGHLYAMDLGHMVPATGLMQLEAEITNFHKSQAEAQGAAQKIINPATGMSPEGQEKVQQDIAVATNPQIQAGKEAVAKAEGEARALIEHQYAVQGNAAVTNVPTHLVGPATEAAVKAGTDYAQAKSVSDRLQAIMDAAKKGNVVSYQLLPEEGALQVVTAQGIHRINTAEISNYGGGSAWQQMQGHIGKALTGKSIPDSVLKDMGDMQDIMARGSKEKYGNTLKTINQSYGSTFKPVDMDNLGGAASFSVQAPNGRTYNFKDQASRDAFKKKAGIQ